MVRTSLMVGFPSTLMVFLPSLSQYNLLVLTSLLPLAMAVLRFDFTFTTLSNSMSKLFDSGQIPYSSVMDVPHGVIFSGTSYS